MSEATGPVRPSRLASVLAIAVVWTVALLPAAAQAAPGDLDGSFATGGVFAQQFGGGSTPTSAFSDTLVQPDGRIVAIGVATPATGSLRNLIVARFMPNGSLDGSFGSGGVYTNTFDTNGIDAETELFGRVALAPDGSILASFITDHGSSSVNQLGLLRLASTGTPVAGFGSGGVVLQQLGAGASPRTVPLALLATPDGRILMAGETTDASANDLSFVERFTAGGSPDGGFGGGGALIHDFGQDSTTATSGASGILAGPGGTYMVSGVGNDSAGHGNFFLARLSSSGAILGTTFAQLGQNSTPASIPLRMVEQPSGKFVLGGYANTAGGSGAYQFALARFNADGTQDLGFGSGGAVLFQPSTASSPDGQLYALASQANGRLVATGLVSGASNSELAITRFMPDGTLDTSFGSGGVAHSVLGQPASPNAYGTGAAIGPDGQLIVAGLQEAAVGVQAYVARFLLDAPPAVTLGAFSPAAPRVGQPVTFDASGSSDDGAIVAYDWDMGSGTFNDAHGSKPTFTFTTPGARTVRVRVTDDDGLTTVASQAVNVSPVLTLLGPPLVIQRFTGVTLAITGLAMDAHGNVFVRIGCPAKAVSPCAGRASLSGESDGSAPRAVLAAKKHRKPKPKLFSFGSASFKVAAGHSVLVKIHLSSRAQALVRRKHKLTARLTIRAHDGSGQSVTTTLKVTIKAPKPKAKRKH